MRYVLGEGKRARTGPNAIGPEVGHGLDRLVMSPTPLLVRALLQSLLAAGLIVLCPPSYAFGTGPIGHQAGECSRTSPQRRLDAAIIERNAKRSQAINLDGVIVMGRQFNLSRQIVTEPFRITNSTIVTPINFIDTLFMSDVDLSGTVFDSDVRVERALFSQNANWRCTKFFRELSHHSSSVNGSISFDNTLFMKGVTFSGAKIGHSAYFSRAVFSTGANFIGAQVAEGSVFEGAVFRGDAAFERATFGKSLWFRERPTEEGVIPGARFVGVANFKATRVGGQAEFSGAVFENEVRMTEARFNEVLFRRTKFVARATREQNEVSFSDAEFGSLDFGGGTERASFDPGRWIQMTGFKYRSLKSPYFMLPLFERLNPYQREPYTQLEKYWRDAAQADEANRIYYARKIVEGKSISVRQPLRWAWDRILKYVFGYGVNLQAPTLWVVGLLAASTVLLARREALVVREGSGGQGFSSTAARQLVWVRLLVAFRMSIGLVIPKLRLVRPKDFRISDQTISVLRRQLPLMYQQVASFARYTAWAIITVSLSIFSISDLVKN